MEIQSPDINALWESFFSEQLEADFMISSPVRTSSNSGYHPNNGHPPFDSSPPHTPSPLAPFNNSNTSNKPKGMSPLQRVFSNCNSPNNQFMEVETVSLPATENFMDCFDSDHDFMGYSTNGNIAGASSSDQSYDPLATIRDLLDCLTLPLPVQSSQPQSQPMSNNHHMFPPPIGAEEHDSGLQLVHLLLASAEAVAKEDFMSARKYLHHLNRVVSLLGDSMQRVASCFTKGLTAHLAATLGTKPPSSNPEFTPFPPNAKEILKIYQLIYQACPYIKFAHFTANHAIFESFEAKERVHIIDHDILQGCQWPAFMQALAARPSGPPFLRIDSTSLSPECVRETGCRCLSELAQSLNAPFEFNPVSEQLEDLEVIESFW